MNIQNRQSIKQKLLQSCYSSNLNTNNSKISSSQQKKLRITLISNTFNKSPNLYQNNHFHVHKKSRVQLPINYTKIHQSKQINAIKNNNSSKYIHNHIQFQYKNQSQIRKENANVDLIKNKEVLKFLSPSHKIQHHNNQLSNISSTSLALKITNPGLNNQSRYKKDDIINPEQIPRKKSPSPDIKFFYLQNDKNREPKIDNIPLQKKIIQVKKQPIQFITPKKQNKQMKLSQYFSCKYAKSISNLKSTENIKSSKKEITIQTQQQLDFKSKKKTQEIAIQTDLKFHDLDDLLNKIQNYSTNSNMKSEKTTPKQQKNQRWYNLSSNKYTSHDKSKFNSELKKRKVQPCQYLHKDMSHNILSYNRDF